MYEISIVHENNLRRKLEHTKERVHVNQPLGGANVAPAYINSCDNTRDTVCEENATREYKAKGREERREEGRKEESVVKRRQSECDNTSSRTETIANKQNRAVTESIIEVDTMNSEEIQRELLKREKLLERRSRLSKQIEERAQVERTLIEDNKNL